MVCFVKIQNFHFMTLSLVTKNPIPDQINQQEDPFLCHGIDFKPHLPLQQDGDEDMQHQEKKLNLIFSWHI